MQNNLTGEEIIEALITNMHHGVMPMRTTTLVPSLYIVKLHPDDYDELEVIFKLIVQEAIQAFEDEIKKLNKKTGLLGLKQQKIFKLVDKWDIRFDKDMDEELRKGEIMIDSKLGVVQKQEFAGTQTLVINRTLRSSTGVSKSYPRSYETVDAPKETLQFVYATITFEDERGQQTYKMTKPEIVIGRGGKNYHTDLKLSTSPDVSREHLRIRYDTLSNRFYARDVSMLGTKVDDQSIESSIEMVNGKKRDKNIEVPIPTRAKITLANVLTLNFDASDAK